MMQQIVFIATLALLALFGAVFWTIVARAKQSDDAKPVAAGPLRVKLFWVLALVGVIYTVATLVPMPIPAQAGAAPAAQTINVTASQWSWDLSSTEVRAGEPVEFLVTSTDVNHGFGIYDESLVLLTQTQAMPDYVNRIVYTFTQPGQYKVLCLEFCGLIHHAMAAEITVLPN